MKNKKIDIVVDKYGHNTFPVLIDTLQNKPKEIIILLINKYENQKIYALISGSISITNIKKGDNDYILVAVPIGNNNYERYFSNRIKIIGE